MVEHALVDGKNLIYKAVFASHTSKDQDVHPAVLVMRQLGKVKRLFKPNKFHIFWDVDNKNLWRRSILPEYKDGRLKNQDFDVKAAVKELQLITAKFVNLLGMPQYIRAANEADDLIYAFVISHPNDKMLIVSGDSDLTQISYKLPNVSVYNSRINQNAILEVPEYDPVIVKSLAGDKTDNIKGYRLVADITAKKIIRSNSLNEFLEIKGRDIFDRNKSVVDLSTNPYVDDNIAYVRSVKEPDIKFDMKEIQNFINSNGLKGMNAEMYNCVLPFRK